MLRFDARKGVLAAIALGSGVLVACSLIVSTSDLSGGPASADSGVDSSEANDSSASDTSIANESAVDDSSGATDSVASDSAFDQGFDSADAGPAPVVTVVGTVGSGTVTVEVAGKFRLVFTLATGWQPTEWYDLLADPGASQDLANKSDSSNSAFLVDPADTQDTASTWLGPVDGTNPTLTIIESGPARAILKSQYTLNQQTPPALPCKTALITTVYNIYASGRIGVDSSLTNEDTAECTVDNFLFGNVTVEPTLDWSVAEYLTKYAYSFTRTSGVGARPAILAIAHNATTGIDFGIDNDGPNNRFWSFGYSTIPSKGSQFDRYEVHLLDDQTPASFADRANDIRNPGLTIVGGANASSATSYDNNQGAYDIGATGSVVTFYPTSAFARYSPAFAIENWTSATFSISLGGTVIASNGSPDGAAAIAVLDAPNKRLVFTYNGVLPAALSTAARTFVVQP